MIRSCGYAQPWRSAAQGRKVNDTSSIIDLPEHRSLSNQHCANPVRSIYRSPTRNLLQRLSYETKLPRQQRSMPPSHPLFEQALQQYASTSNNAQTLNSTRHPLLAAIEGLWKQLLAPLASPGVGRRDQILAAF